MFCSFGSGSGGSSSFGVPVRASLISQDPFCQGLCRRTKGGNKENESTSSSLSRRNQVLKVWKSIVLVGKMGMRKFGSVAPPFGKVVYAVGFQFRAQGFNEAVNQYGVILAYFSYVAIKFREVYQKTFRSLSHTVHLPLSGNLAV